MLRLPAEWEDQSFLQVTFPHVNSDWHEMLEKVSECYIEIIETVSEFQDILIICDNKKVVRSYFKNNNRKYFIELPTNDTWIRDYGGITLTEENSSKILDFRFNGWGNKFNASLDNQATKKIFQNKYLINCSSKELDFVLEGGSIESDGIGTVMTTTECLLSVNRNPGLDKTQIENRLKEYFNAQRILWLDHGMLTGDDTDSHIDTLARFCNINTICYVYCDDKNDEHFLPLKNMKSQLENFKQTNGEIYNLIELPFPDACFDKEGNRLPATYANFCIINGAVLVPLYNVRQDNEALRVLKDCFPKRKVIGIDCRILIEQHGSLHCSTMQYPKQVQLNKKLLS